jgi:hypothetical protein
MPTAVSPTQAPPTSRVNSVAWTPCGDIDFAEWARTGQRLGAMGRCGQWGLGDWLRYGNAKFGEKYARAAKITKYDIQTLMNMVYVAGKFEFSRRRENLSWSHHETVACLAPDEQDRWLDTASLEKLSISDLRQELRRSRRPSKTDVAAQLNPSAAKKQHIINITCPHCGQSVPLPPVFPRSDRSKKPARRLLPTSAQPEADSQGSLRAPEEIPSTSRRRSSAQI